jgi:hypothetical protein
MLCNCPRWWMLIDGSNPKNVSASRTIPAKAHHFYGFFDDARRLTPLVLARQNGFYPKLQNYALFGQKRVICLIVAKIWRVSTP